MQTLKSILLPGALCGLILYFSYHALAGEQGLAAWTHLQGEEKTLQKELASIKAEQASVETNLVRLRDDTMDLDYIEELVRTRMSYARPDEILVAAR
ncbi:MAG: septum formation initiator family protein [Hyphomonadaceae bacterium]